MWSLEGSEQTHALKDKPTHWPSLVRLSYLEIVIRGDHEESTQRYTPINIQRQAIQSAPKGQLA